MTKYTFIECIAVIEADDLEDAIKKLKEKYPDKNVKNLEVVIR